MGRLAFPQTCQVCGTRLADGSDFDRLTLTLPRIDSKQVRRPKSHV